MISDSVAAQNGVLENTSKWPPIIFIHAHFVCMSISLKEIMK